jgi:hypothetical protein
MSDPQGRAHAMPASPPLRQPLSASDDYRLQETRRAAGSEYDVLGEIGEVVDGVRSGIAFLARRRSSARLDALRLVSTGEYVEVLGEMGESTQDVGEQCPTCGTPIRAGVRFCGSCRADLATTPVGAATSTMSVAEWLDARSEAARNGYELVGRIDVPRMRAAGVAQNGSILFLARTSATSKIVMLMLERAAAGGSAVIGLDQSSAMAGVVESLFDASPAPAPVRPALPEMIPPPPTVAPLPERPVVAPLPPLPPPVVRTPGPEIPWLRIAAITLSGAALIAALAWLVTALSSRRSEPAIAVSADSVLADTARRAAAPIDSAPRAAAIVDSATLRIAADLPAGAAITVDGVRVSGRTVRLAPGRHTLSALAPGYSTQRQALRVRPGQSLAWPPQLVAKPKPVEPASVPRPATVASACADAAGKSDWARVLDVCAKETNAPNGNAFAERTLGSMYERGLGVAPSMLVAAVWYSAAAGHGDREAQYRYALMLQYGSGVRQNPTEAAQWFLKAAERGHAEAQAALGMLYAIGDGVTQSDADAAKWLKRAAAQGSDRARQELVRRNW